MRWLAPAVGALAVATPLRSQSATAPKAPAPPMEVRGIVSRAVGVRPVPVPAARVTLHRVGRDGAGPVDSMRADAAGRYAFHFRPTGDTSAVYFASSSWAGIAYFTPPLRAGAQHDGDADIALFDTTSAPIPIHVRSRHVIVAAPDSGGARTVMEVFVISNDTTVTRIASRGGATFEAILPDAAREPGLGQSDVAADGVTFARGRARVVAPLAPGMKRVTFQYRLPTTPATFEVARAGPTLMLEVLVEDAKGAARGAGLSEVSATSLEGRSFRRFLAQEVAANAPISVTAPTTAAGAFSNPRVAFFIIAVGAALLLGLGATISRRGPLFVRRRAAGNPDTIARQIAALDEAFEKKATPTAGEKADHYERRAHLKARLTAVLAKRDGLT